MVLILIWEMTTRITASVTASQEGIISLYSLMNWLTGSTAMSVPWPRTEIM